MVYSKPGVLTRVFGRLSTLYPIPSHAVLQHQAQPRRPFQGEGGYAGIAGRNLSFSYLAHTRFSETVWKSQPI